MATTSAVQAVRKFRLHELKGLSGHIARNGPLPSPPPGSRANAVSLPNPFVPQLNPKTGRWAPAKYSLRRQADLIKKARLAGPQAVAALPPGPKMQRPVEVARQLKANATTEAQAEESVVLAFSVNWIGKFTPAKVSKKAARVPLYENKKRMFKGHKWERVKERRIHYKFNLLRDMNKRIHIYKTVRVLLDLLCSSPYHPYCSTGIRRSLTLSRLTKIPRLRSYPSNHISYILFNIHHVRVLSQFVS
jgi:large subunit ribosomal protein L25